MIMHTHTSSQNLLQYIEATNILNPRVSWFPDLILQLSFVNSFPYLQWELVQWVDLLQVIQDKVQQWRPGSSRSIVLPSNINILLCSFRLLYFLFDLRGRSFGCLEVFYESRVAKEIAAGRGETREERVFKLFEFDLELILLSSQFSLSQCIHAYHYAHVINAVKT